MTSTISASIAQEHLGDGQDNIKEAANTIKRVLKSYPELASELDEATIHLASAREKMQLARRRLPK